MMHVALSNQYAVAVLQLSPAGGGRAVFPIQVSRLRVARKSAVSTVGNH